MLQDESNWFRIHTIVYVRLPLVFLKHNNNKKKDKKRRSNSLMFLLVYHSRRHGNWDSSSRNVHYNNNSGCHRKGSSSSHNKHNNNNDIGRYNNRKWNLLSKETKSTTTETKIENPWASKTKKWLKHLVFLINIREHLFNNQEQQKKFKHVRLGKQKPAQALNIVVEDHKALVYNPN